MSLIVSTCTAPIYRMTLHCRYLKLPGAYSIEQSPVVSYGSVINGQFFTKNFHIKFEDSIICGNLALDDEEKCFMGYARGLLIVQRQIIFLKANLGLFFSLFSSFQHVTE